MNLDRPLRPRRERYDEVRYRESLLTLGLFPPIAREDIDRAYRWRARQAHPDRFASEDEKAEATRRIQRINEARDYATRHFRGFDLYQSQAYRESRPGRARADGGWFEWALLPVTVVYALATLLAAAPVLIASALLGDDGRARWTARLGRWGTAAWRLWMGVGPHLVALALFVLARGLLLEVWIGLSILVMASADVATIVTGDANELRRHRAVDGARSLAEGLARPA